jgi:hypothetical protein
VGARYLAGTPRPTFFLPTLTTQSKGSSLVRLIPKIRYCDYKLAWSRSCGNREDAQLVMAREYVFRPQLRHD